MKLFNDELLQSICDNNIEMLVRPDGIQIGGFYKSDNILLNYEDDLGWVAVARYGERTQISTFEHLVELNLDWWERSKDRYEGWKEYNWMWKDAIEYYYPNYKRFEK